MRTSRAPRKTTVRSGEARTKRRAPSPERLGRRLLTVAAAGSMLAAVTAQPSGAFAGGDFTATGVSGLAYGSEGRLTHSSLPSVRIGRVALQTMPCNPGADASEIVTIKNYDNQIQLLNIILPGQSAVETVIRTGVVENNGTASNSPSASDVQETSRIANVSLLNGMITATTVEAKAHMTLTSAGFNNHLNPPDGTTGSTLVDLTINGQAISADAPPNTTIQLPNGLGRVVLNEQISFGSKFGYPQASGIKVNALHVYVDNFFGYSGDFVVAHAETRLSPSPAGLIGFAYLSKVTGAVGSVITSKSGPQNIVNMPCPGTNGADKTSISAGVSIPAPSGAAFSNLVSTATSTSTVNGKIFKDGNGVAKSAYTESKELIQNVSLLGGRITADAIFSDSRTDGSTAGVTSFDNGSYLANVRVDGITLTGAVAPNTEIPLPGIGRVVLNYQRCIDQNGNTLDGCTGGNFSAMTIHAIHVFVNDEPNDANLPVKAQIIVGAAHSGVLF